MPIRNLRLRLKRCIELVDDGESTRKLKGCVLKCSSLFVDKGLLS